MPAPLICGVLAFCFALACVSLWVEERVQAKDGVFLYGPLYGGAYFYVSTALLMAGVLWALRLTVRQTLPSGSGELLKALADGPLRWPVACLLLGCLLSTAYGYTAYWQATPDRIIVHPGWPSQPEVYSSKDMRERTISCTHFKGRTEITFDVLMRDGRTISLGSGTHSRLEAGFEKVVALTDSVGQNRIGDYQACPGYLHAFVDRLRAAAGLAPR